MKTTRFNDLEALRIAVQIERQGERFYRIMARMVDNAQEQKALTLLAEQEIEHMHRFGSMHEQVLEAHQKEGTPPRYYGERANALLSAVSMDIIFPQGIIATFQKHKADTLPEAIDYAMQLEKNSIFFYQQVLMNTSQPRCQDIFNTIIEEEMDHLQELTQWLEQIAIDYKNRA